MRLIAATLVLLAASPVFADVPTLRGQFAYDRARPAGPRCAKIAGALAKKLETYSCTASTTFAIAKRGIACTKGTSTYAAFTTAADCDAERDQQYGNRHAPPSDAPKIVNTFAFEIMQPARACVKVRGAVATKLAKYACKRPDPNIGTASGRAEIAECVRGKSTFMLFATADDCREERLTQIANGGD